MSAELSSTFIMQPCIVCATASANLMACIGNCGASIHAICAGMKRHNDKKRDNTCPEHLVFHCGDCRSKDKVPENVQDSIVNLVNIETMNNDKITAVEYNLKALNGRFDNLVVFVDNISKAITGIENTLKTHSLTTSITDQLNSATAAIKNHLDNLPPVPQPVQSVCSCVTEVNLEKLLDDKLSKCAVEPNNDEIAAKIGDLVKELCANVAVVDGQATAAPTQIPISVSIANPLHLPETRPETVLSAKARKKKKSKKPHKQVTFGSPVVTSANRTATAPSITQKIRKSHNRKSPSAPSIAEEIRESLNRQTQSQLPTTSRAHVAPVFTSSPQDVSAHKWIHVYNGVDSTSTADGLRDFIKKKLKIDDVLVVCLATAQSSRLTFKVRIPEVHADKLLNPAWWPKGVLTKEFIHRQRTGNFRFSRELAVFR